MQMINNPQFSGVPFDPYQGSQQGQFFQQGANPYGYMQNSSQVVQNNVPPQKVVDPRAFETPEITLGESHKPLFSVKNDITVDNASDVEIEERKKRKSSKKLPTTTESGAIIKADKEPLKGEVDNSATIYTYQETNGLLHETLGQIDAINLELVQEFNNVKHNRTLKNKYMILNNLSENIGAMISNRISTIKEINNCISKSNDMDYKRYKDMQAAQSAITDDKYIADVYQALMSNPKNQAPVYQMPQIDPSILGSGIVRTTIAEDPSTNNGIVDAGYLQYVANMTPEQNAMRFEDDPNIQQVVVYDAATGAKAFQVINVATGEAIPNMPVYDMMMMEEFTLDLDKKIAKSINLNQTLPLVILNNNITSQY